MKRRDIVIGCAFLILRYISIFLTIAATYYAFTEKSAIVALQLLLAAFWIEAIGEVAFNGRRQR
ncbi:hypothetical protein GG496_001499 [Candidatus Fervidibacteria bacterium JGI MDM2 JNZ-1-D12]